MFKRIVAVFGAAVFGAGALVAPASAAPARAGVTLTGAGSTFDQPFFTKAFDVYGGPHNLSVNYQPVGSGAGIQLFTAKQVDFGATDVPMDPTSELSKAVQAGGSVVQIPIALGGISVAYNLPGVKSGLHLSGPVVADIFLGIITKWNDGNIKRLNRRVKLPDTAIVVAHRSDGSGTSYAFTDYLSKVSDTWRGKIGVSKLPNWPTGVGGKGNAGVAAVVQQQPGSIGYVELAFVLQNHMKQAAIENRKHNFLTPTPKTVAAEAASFPALSARRFSIVDGNGKNGYPISTFSWVLAFKHQSDATKGKALSKLLLWLATTGQKYAGKLDYVPLPKKVQSLAATQVKQIK
ncbi:MAG: phosphate ABC transporter substrate-binding protein PstS [Chloroflexota bacterium]